MICCAFSRCRRPQASIWVLDPGPNRRPVARAGDWNGSIRASAARGQGAQRQHVHVPARPSSSGTRHGALSPPIPPRPGVPGATTPDVSHTGRPFLLTQPPVFVLVCGLSSRSATTSRIHPALGPCSCCGRRRHARKRTSIRVLISRPSPPVPKNSIPPFLLASYLSFSRSLLRSIQRVRAEILLLV